MDEIRFEWDVRKARANKKKHGVSFHDAATAFRDEQGLLRDDAEHSDDEERFVLLGLSASLRLLVVVHTTPGRGVIRIISARRATRFETRDYESRLSP